MANYASLQFFDNFSEENVNGAENFKLRVSPEAYHPEQGDMLLVSLNIIN